jgi:two-component system, NarL family, sensor histidine kinase UhpB
VSSHGTDIQLLVEGDRAERRLIRLALDLHDGPLQEVAAVLGELRLFRSQLEEILPATAYRGRVLGRFDDLEARMMGLDSELRGLVSDSDSPPSLDAPFREALLDQIDEIAIEAGIRVSLALDGDVDTSRSQRIALLRVVREALVNVGKHSGAGHAEVTVHLGADAVQAEVWDEGDGFDVEFALVQAARQGRLGLVGMAERARLLGGGLEIDSRPGGPTRVSLTLPVWHGDDGKESWSGEAA